MCEDANDFFAFRSLADFVEFVKVNDWIHGTALDDDFDDFTPRASFVCVGMTLQETAVRRTTERDESEVATEYFADTLLHKRRLSSTHRTLDCNSASHGGRVGNPLTDHLHNLEFRVIETVDGSVECGL